jgi:hypothetical protein
LGNFLEGARQAEASPELVWEILADVDRWPQTITPYLKAAHLDGGIEVGAKGWVQITPIPRSHFEIDRVDDGRSWAWTGRIL